MRLPMSCWGLWRMPLTQYLKQDTVRQPPYPQLSRASSWLLSAGLGQSGCRQHYSTTHMWFQASPSLPAWTKHDIITPQPHNEMHNTKVKPCNQMHHRWSISLEKRVWLWNESIECLQLTAPELVSAIWHKFHKQIKHFMVCMSSCKTLHNLSYNIIMHIFWYYFTAARPKRHWVLQNDVMAKFYERPAVIKGLRPTGVTSSQVLWAATTADRLVVLSSSYSSTEFLMRSLYTSWHSPYRSNR